MSRWTIREVQDGSGDRREGSGRVGEPSERFKTSRGTLPRFGMVWGTLLKVRDWSGDSRVGQGMV